MNEDETLTLTRVTLEDHKRIGMETINFIEKISKLNINIPDVYKVELAIISLFNTKIHLDQSYFNKPKQEVLDAFLKVLKISAESFSNEDEAS